jgi:hypothetical protein
LGNASADLLAISWVKKRAQNRNEPVLISGTALKVLTATEGLLRAGIDPQKIVCLISESDEMIEGCSDMTQTALIAQSPVLAGVKQVYWRSSVSEVTLSRTGFIHSVDIQEVAAPVRTDNPSDPLNRPVSANSNNSYNLGEEKNNINNNNEYAVPSHLTCIGLLLCAGREFQSCERDIFAAINDCGLVFDGGLVVDKVRGITDLVFL